MVALLIGVGVRLNASDLVPVTGELPPPAITPCPDLSLAGAPRAGPVKQGRRSMGAGTHARQRLVLDRAEHGGILPSDRKPTTQTNHPVTLLRCPSYGWRYNQDPPAS